MKNYKNKIWKLVNTWEKEFRLQARENEYLPFYGLIDPEDEDEIECAESALDDQTDFIRMLICFKLLDAETEENMARIRTFLDLQRVEQPDGVPSPAIDLTFHGPGYRTGLLVYVDELGQVDFADTWSETRFQIINIYHNQWRVWTGKRIDAIIEHIKDDFDFDGIDAQLRIPHDSIGSSTKNMLEIQVTIDE